MEPLLSRRRRLLKPSNAKASTVEPNRFMLGDQHKFDEETGQVYSETTASIPSSHERNWFRLPSTTCAEVDFRDNQDYRRSFQSDLSVNCGNSLKEPRAKRSMSSKGVRSLQETAIECIIHNISNVTSEVIEYLPNQLVQRIWHEAKRRKIVSLTTWKIFSKLLSQSDAATLSLLRYRQSIIAPKLPLHMYTNPITSKSFDFITSLSITTVFPIPDLFKLSIIPNLGILEIINSEGSSLHGVGDRLIRAWHLAAVDDGAFSVLRILKLWNHKELTGQSLIYLNSFPALAIYDVSGCGFNLNSKIDARRFGWRPTWDIDLLELLDKTCVEKVTLLQAAQGSESNPIHKLSTRQLSDKELVARVTRAEVTSFLTHLGLKTPAAPPIQKKQHNLVCLEDLDKSKSETATTKKPKKTTGPVINARRKAETWDAPAYNSFARIGQLRNDLDLARAGIAIGDQAVVDSQLVNSLPMVSLRLGKTPCHARNLAFIRVKLPVLSDEAPRTRTHGHESKTEDEAVTPLSATPAPRLKPIMRKKKRALDDVLSSFL